VPAGCCAEFELRSDTLKKSGSAGAGAKLTAKNTVGQELGVPVSFKGFTPAFDALVKQ
jgi:invasion protein IalB